MRRVPKGSNQSDSKLTFSIKPESWNQNECIFQPQERKIPGIPELVQILNMSGPNPFPQSVQIQSQNDIRSQSNTPSENVSSSEASQTTIKQTSANPVIKKKVIKKKDSGSISSSGGVISEVSDRSNPQYSSEKQKRFVKCIKKSSRESRDGNQNPQRLQSILRIVRSSEQQSNQSWSSSFKRCLSNCVRCLIRVLQRLDSQLSVDQPSRVQSSNRALINAEERESQSNSDR
jgi:hypothetical protein